jgi:uncharacterized membrane protein
MRSLPLWILLASIAAVAQPPPESDKPFTDDDLDQLLEPEDGGVAAPAEDPPLGEKDPELTDEQAAALGFASLCCCGVFTLGVIGLVVWLIVRASKKSPGPGQPEAFAPAPLGPMQLSIIALALEPSARPTVEQQLAQLSVSFEPTTAELRGRLVRETARAMLTVQPAWRQFGYGEKSNLPDLSSAEASYRAAAEDFRSRAQSVGTTSNGEGGLVVLTLLVCSRRALLGVDGLDDPQQVRRVLEDRMKVGDAELVGAQLRWAPAAPGGQVSEAEIGLRFPEMLPLRRPNF